MNKYSSLVKQYLEITNGAYGCPVPLYLIDFKWDKLVFDESLRFKVSLQTHPKWSDKNIKYVWFYGEPYSHIKINEDISKEVDING